MSKLRAIPEEEDHLINLNSEENELSVQKEFDSEKKGRVLNRLDEEGHGFDDENLE